jgi:small subunit ribosomal protein S16
MLTIRLTRVGKKKDASFRVIVIDSKRKVKAGNYLEMLGSYDPRVDTATLKADRIKHWMSEGARPSDTVHNLLITHNIIEGKKINVLPRKTVPKKDLPAQAGEPAAKATGTVETGLDASVGGPTGDVGLAEEKPADTITE